MKTYQIAMEIAGPTAMWTRPDTGDCPVSYPAPTYSAVKGIFESVAWGPAIEIVPVTVEICAPLHYHQYQTNYGGPLRSSEQIKKGNGYQFLATVLTNVCYRMYAQIYPARKVRPDIKLPDRAKEWDSKTTSPAHALKAIFERRLRTGKWFTLPFLGWKEFTPSYLGEIRESTRVQEEISTVIPSMLREVFPNGYQSTLDFTYDQNVKIERGVLVYPLIQETCHD